MANRRWFQNQRQRSKTTKCHVLTATLMCDRYGISSFVYRARKPFHPKRLFDLIHDKFIVLQNVAEVDDEEGEEDDDASSGSEDEAMGGTSDENEGAEEDSDTEMEDDLAGKDFQKEIDPKVTLCLVNYRSQADYHLVQIILQNKKIHPAFSGLLRSKGFIWLATRPNQHGEWSQAGGMLTLGGGAPWFCTVPRGES